MPVHVSSANLTGNEARVAEAERPEETLPNQLGRFVPGVSSYRLELLTAYLEGRNLLGRRLDFRLGRQMRIDPLGFYLFDGGLVLVHLPYSVAVEGYGGLEVRGGIPFSPERFEPDGLQRLSREGLDPAEFPTIESPTIPWVVAGAIRTDGYMPLHAIASETSSLGLHRRSGSRRTRASST